MDGVQRGIAEILSTLSQSPSQLNLPKADEQETYTCEPCGNVIDRLFIQPLGKYVFPVCPCVNVIREKEEEFQARMYRKKKMEAAYRENIMNEALTDARFDNFIKRNGTELMFTAAKEFAEQFESRKTGLLCYGDPGNGKSHLCASIHHELDKQGFVSLFLDCSQLFNIAEGTKKFSSKISISDIVNAAIGCDLLTLDELGSVKIRQEDYDNVLFAIINGRQGKKTNYTSNLDLDELKQWLITDRYGKSMDTKGRLIDRILGTCDILKNNGTSYRQEQAAKRFNEAAGKDKKRQWA